MPDPNHFLEAVRALAASHAILQSQTKALELTILAIAQQSNVTLDGQPVRDWLRQKRDEELEKLLIEMENQNPGLSARVQAMIDESRKRHRN